MICIWSNTLKRKDINRCLLATSAAGEATIAKGSCEESSKEEVGPHIGLGEFHSEMSFYKLSDAPCRHQQCFSGLDVKVEDEMETFSSFTSTFSGSTGSLSSNVFSSISGVLSSAMASALTLSPEECQKLGYNGPEDYHSHSIFLKPTAQEPNFRSFDPKTVAINTELSFVHMPSPNLGRIRSEPIVDFDWLLERCGSDGQLVLEVLQSFCEQGQHHLNAIQNCIREHDTNRLIFHSVSLVPSVPSFFFGLLGDQVGAELPRRLCLQHRGQGS